MKQFTAEEIQKKFDSLPKILQEAVTSSEMNEKIESIGKRHNLLIDQIGELVDQVGLVMLGLEKGLNFVNNLSEALSISRYDAQSIADEVNTEVFTSIKNSMREMTTEPETISTKNEFTQRSAVAPQNFTTQPPQPRKDEYYANSVEHVGGFTLHREKVESNPNGGVMEQDKDKILSHLENPPWKSSPIVPEEMPEKIGVPSYGMAREAKTEPVVDLMEDPQSRPKLGSEHDQTIEPKIKIESVRPASPQQMTPEIPSNLPTDEKVAQIHVENESSASLTNTPKIEQAPAIKPPPVPESKPDTPPPPPIPNRSGPDPYREAVE